MDLDGHTAFHALLVRIIHRASLEFRPQLASYFDSPNLYKYRHSFTHFPLSMDLGTLVPFWRRLLLTCCVSTHCTITSASAQARISLISSSP